MKLQMSKAENVTTQFAFWWARAVIRKTNQAFVKKPPITAKINQYSELYSCMYATKKASEINMQHNEQVFYFCHQ